MALLNIFKKKKKGEKPKIKPSPVTEEKREVKPEKPKEVIAPKVRKDYNPPTTSSRLRRAPIKIGEAYRILKVPHVTERATDLAKKNQYVFEIYPRANKPEVKKAVEDVYGVDVISVKIVNIPEKKRRLGKRQGVKSGYKKAIVRIKEGQRIEVLPR